MTVMPGDIPTLPSKGNTDWYSWATAIDGRSRSPRVLRPEAYGATGNGTTDDQNAFAAMFAAMKAGDTVVLEPSVAYRHSNVLTWPTPNNTVLQFGPLVASDTTRAAVQVSTVAKGIRWKGFNHRVDWGSATPVRGGTDILTAPLACWDVDDIQFDGVYSELSRQCGVYLSTVRRFKFRNVQVYRSQADSFHMTHACEDGEMDDYSATWCGDDGIAIVSYLTRGQGGPAVGQCKRIRVRGIKVRYTHARGATILGGLDCSFTDIDVAWTRAAGCYMGSEAGYNTHAATNCKMTNGRIRDVGYPLPSTDVGATGEDAALDHGHLFMLSQQSGTPVVNCWYEDFEVGGGGTLIFNSTRAITNNGATYTGCGYRRVRLTPGKELRTGGIAAPGGTTAGCTYEKMMDLR